jgi:hypothetical protein
MAADGIDRDIAEALWRGMAARLAIRAASNGEGADGEFAWVTA